jgi:DNA processing protein
VVIEGTIQSGALVTARLALDANREVFAVPGSVRNVMAQGPNELIRRGEAALVTDALQILESLGSAAPTRTAATPPPVQLTSTQEAVLAHLDDVPVGIDALTKSTGLDGSEVNTALSLLELDRLARRSYRGYVITDPGAAVRAALLGCG